MFNSKSGKVKIKIFAILLLALSTSGVISSYRSISRSFNGIVLSKHSEANHYWITIFPTDKNRDYPLTNENIVLALQNKISGIRVGVSSVVYAQVSPARTISKDKFSPYVNVDTEKHIDLGVIWFVFSLTGYLISFFMYSQTAKVTKDGQPQA